MDIKTRIRKEQKRISGLVARKFKDYYFAGGTALAFHFDHRFSEDLDFFSPVYDARKVDKVMEDIKAQTGFSFYLEDEIRGNKKMAAMKVFYLNIAADAVLKVDFVEDVIQNVFPVQNGLLSVPDIYIRKIYAAIGVRGRASSVGRSVAGGRQSVKDLYDLYTLSRRHETLIKFFPRYFPVADMTRLESWYKGFDRTEAMLELLDLDVKDDPRKVFVYMDKVILQEMQDLLKGFL